MGNERKRESCGFGPDGSDGNRTSNTRAYFWVSTTAGNVNWIHNEWRCVNNQHPFEWWRILRLSLSRQIIQIIDELWCTASSILCMKSINCELQRLDTTFVCLCSRWAPHTVRPNDDRIVDWSTVCGDPVLVSRFGIFNRRHRFNLLFRITFIWATTGNGHTIASAVLCVSFVGFCDSICCKNDSNK